MQSYSPVAVDRVMFHLRSHGYSVQNALSGFEVFPVSLAKRKDNSIFFVSDPKHLSSCERLSNSIIFGPQSDFKFDNESLCFVPCDNPRATFFGTVSSLFLPGKMGSGIHPSAVVDTSSTIGEGVIIGANVVIGAGCEIGDGTEIRAGVIIHDNVSIGNECLIKSGTVIGQEGFGLYRSEGEANVLIPHLGGVKIGDRVLIGALNTVCSGTLDPTVIGDGTKFDDHIHIAHNCIIGSDVVITACAELSGSVTVEDRVWIGPQSALMNKITIGHDAFLGLGAVVTKDVAAASVVAGNPARLLRKNA